MVRRLAMIGLTLVLATGAAARLAAAQVISGTVEGRVRDTQGGVLPGVSITATNTGTAAAFVAQTTSEGLYRLTFLPPGTYDVRANLSGFRTETKTGVVVRVNESAVVNFDLSVAAVSETITVQAAPSSVQLTRSELKRTYDEATLKEIPIATTDTTGRNVYSIATKAPGVTTPGGRFGRAFLGSGGGNVIANGTTARSTNYELDGISNIDPEDNDYRTPVSVEGVREFEVLTANYNAEFGRAGGAQVRAVSKSGTNVVHGSAFEYFYDNERFQSEATDVQPRPPCMTGCFTSRCSRTTSAAATIPRPGPFRWRASARSTQARRRAIKS
jgi:hypothetical protein